MDSISSNELPNKKVERPITWLRYICHQRPDRCFSINGKPMPLCARCLGFYLGLFLGIFIPIIFNMILLVNIRILLILLLISVTPLAIDGLSQLVGMRVSNNKLRFATGLFAGIVLGIVFVWLLMHIFIID